MYIFIFEDNEIIKSTTFNNDDVEACNNRFLDVIYISDDNPKQFIDGEWCDIDITHI